MRRADEPTGAGPRPVKRSFIDSRIDRMLDLCSRYGVALPPFALWRDADFRSSPDAARLIAERGMGWNVVEFKPGLFAREGLTLFTLRMGDWRELRAGRGRLYGEKAILAEDDQRAPHHYHEVKTEDIVNRGGARFVVELFKVDAHGAPLKQRFRALKDVSVLDLGPGDRVRLEPGESLTLVPFIAHAFRAEGGAARGRSVARQRRCGRQLFPSAARAISADRRGRAGALRDGHGPRAALGRAAPLRRSKHCRVK
jgi:hypothetical protein